MYDNLKLAGSWPLNAAQKPAGLELWVTGNLEPHG